MRYIKFTLCLFIALAISSGALGSVPLTPTGLCLEPNGDCLTADKITQGHKWNPGHYMLTYWGDQPKAVYDKILNEPYIKGVKNRYPWRLLEPEKGKYDFSMIEKDLEYLQKHGKRLVIFPYYMYARNPIPDYIKEDPQYKGILKSDKKSSWEIPKLWVPAVMDRLIALYKALGKRFNHEPFVEAITTMETSIGINKATKDDPASHYSDEAYVAQLKRFVAESKKAFPNTLFLKDANTMAGNRLPVMESFVEFVYQNNAGISGPDIIPGIENLAQRISKTYAGKMPLGADVQTSELCGVKGCFLPEQLYQHGVNNLKLNYIFWIEKGTDKGKEYSFQYGILPAINKQKGKINIGCPKNISPCLTQ